MSDSLNSVVSSVNDSSDKEPPGSSPKFIDRKQFYQKFFPNSTQEDWSNWKWQIKNRIINLEQLSKFIKLTKEEKDILIDKKENLPLSITPYYMSLIDLNDINDPIRKCVVPRINESFKSPEESIDPLGEDHQSPVECIVHRYPDRVLFLSTKFCSVGCRFCTRSRMIQQNYNSTCQENEWQKAFKYINDHSEIRDVLISGGDPLTLSDKKIEYLLSNIRKIKHVEIIRIGTKVPVVLPQRITNNLLSIIKKYHPLFMSLHFTHPTELTKECTIACNKLANAGIPLGSQTVLLKDINDTVEIMTCLFTGLLKIRVRPYYMYQCDLISGISHFRTPLEDGLNIIKGLRGWTSGYAVPQFIIDSPNGKGKIPILPNYIKDRTDKIMTIINYQDEEVEYPINI